MELDRNKGL